MATTFYCGTYPCCHGNSKSRRALGQGEATGGAEQWTGRWVFQNPGRRSKPTKKTNKTNKQKKNYIVTIHITPLLLLTCQKGCHTLSRQSLIISRKQSSTPDLDQIIDLNYLLLCKRILLLRSTQLSLPGSMCKSVFLVLGWPWNKRLSWTKALTGPSTAMPQPRAG